MEKSYTKIYTTGATVPLKIRPGHFATNHAHINYYIDVTTLKARTKEAEDVAQALVGMYLYDTVIDTIVCMEGTEVIGAFLAEELAKGGFLSTNAHKSIYVISPEFNNNSQIIFRDNLIPMIRDKHVMILMASVTTGRTLNKAVESIQYYGGILQGASAISVRWIRWMVCRSSQSLARRIYRIIRIQITVTARSARQERRLMRW